MFKFLVLAVLLWLEVVKAASVQPEISVFAEPTTPLAYNSENELDTTFQAETSDFAVPTTPLTTPLVKNFKNDLAKEPKEKYHFEAAKQYFYVGAFPLTRSSGFAKNMPSEFKQLPADYIVTEGIGAHKLHLSNATWNKARQTCIKEGGHLAIIRSHAEEKIVVQMMNDQSLLEAWVGYHNKFEEGEWVSVLDEPLEDISRARWSKEFDPNPSGDSTECAQLLSFDGGLDDYDCDHEQPFICKIPMEK